LIVAGFVTTFAARAEEMDSLSDLHAHALIDQALARYRTVPALLAVAYDKNARGLIEQREFVMHRDGQRLVRVEQSVITADSDAAPTLTVFLKNASGSWTIRDGPPEPVRELPERWKAIPPRPSRLLAVPLSALKVRISRAAYSGMECQTISFESFGNPATTGQHVTYWIDSKTKLLVAFQHRSASGMILRECGYHEVSLVAASTTIFDLPTAATK
jgi:hypothetical protein